MNKAILALFLAFNFFSAFSAGASGNYSSTFSGNYIDKYAGKYMNGTNSTTTPGTNSTSNSTKNYTGNYKDFSSQKACPKALNKTNQAISEFAGAVVSQKDQWTIFSSAEKLNGLGYSLEYSCKTADLKLLNKGKTGVNKTQDQACSKLIEIIQPILDQSGSGTSSGDYQSNLNLTNQALGLASSLGNKCNVTLVDQTQEEEEAVISEEEYYPEEEYLGEEWAYASEEVVDIEGFTIKVVDREGGKEDTYTIYYNPENNTSPGLVIVHTISEEEAAIEEEEAEVQGIDVRVVERNATQQDTYVIHLRPQSKGKTGLVIQHTEENLEEEESSGNSVSFIQSQFNKNGWKNGNGNGEYQKQYNSNNGGTKFIKF